MPRHNPGTVELPSAAQENFPEFDFSTTNAADPGTVELPSAAQENFPEFDFSTTNAHVPPSTVEPLAHIPTQAAPHVPSSVPASTVEPLAHIPTQAAPHVPSSVPLQELPNQASETAIIHPGEENGVPWWFDLDM